VLLAFIVGALKIAEPSDRERWAGKTPSRVLACADEGSFYLAFLGTFLAKKKY
jgi:hypothetical protein